MFSSQSAGAVEVGFAFDALGLPDALDGFEEAESVACSLISESCLVCVDAFSVPVAKLRRVRLTVEVVKMTLLKG